MIALTGEAPAFATSRPPVVASFVVSVPSEVTALPLAGGHSYDHAVELPVTLVSGNDAGGVTVVVERRYQGAHLLAGRVTAENRAGGPSMTSQTRLLMRQMRIGGAWSSESDRTVTTVNFRRDGVPLAVSDVSFEITEFDNLLPSYQDNLTFDQQNFFVREAMSLTTTPASRVSVSAGASVVGSGLASDPWGSTSVRTGSASSPHNAIPDPAGWIRPVVEGPISDLSLAFWSKGSQWSQPGSEQNYQYFLSGFTFTLR